MTIKAISETRFGGYGVLFGSPAQRDLQREYFTADTDYALNWTNLRPALYHHGQDDAIGAEPIGTIDTIKADAIGLWLEGQWNSANRYADAVKQLAKEGKLGWSSGTLSYLKRVDPDGKITRWPLVEASMTPTPAEPRATGVSAKHFAEQVELLGAFKSIGITPNLSLLQESAALSATDSASKANEAAPEAVQANKESQIMEITQEALNALITQAAEAGAQKALAAQPAPVAPPTKSLENVPDPLKDAKAIVPQPGEARITVTRATKWSDLTANQMSFAAELLTAASGGGWKPDEFFKREIGDKITKSVARGTMFGAAYEQLPEQYGGYKSNEVVNTGQASYGTEWVADSWRTQLWPKARQENVVLREFMSIDMPTDPYEFPFESTDPTVYHAAETTNEAQLAMTSAGPITISKPGTGKVQAATEKMALRFSFTAEQAEDSVIVMAPIYQSQAERAMLNAFDNGILNGDTVLTANTNVNLYDATPGGTELYTTFNGIRKYAIITNTAQTVAGGGAAPTLAKLRAARFALSPAMYYRVNDLVCFVDNGTYAKLLDLPEFLTADKVGGAGTAQSGLIGTIDGIRVLPSAELGLAYTTGKISTTGGNNTTGTALYVFKPNWMVGYRRQIKSVMEYVSYSDAWLMTMTARLTLVSNGSSTKSASALVNLAV